jgi:hypothetical protein
VIDSKVQMQFLSPQHRLLFSKSEASLLKGEPSEMLRGLPPSDRNATRWAAQAKNDTDATMQVKREQMKLW